MLSYANGFTICNLRLKMFPSKRSAKGVYFYAETDKRMYLKLIRQARRE